MRLAQHQTERSFGGRFSRGSGARRTPVCVLTGVGKDEITGERAWEGSTVWRWENSVPSPL